MVNKHFLDKMYERLHEAKEIQAANRRESVFPDNEAYKVHCAHLHGVDALICSLNSSIKDYLEIHGAGNGK